MINEKHKVTDYCICHEVDCPLKRPNLKTGNLICEDFKNENCRYSNIHVLNGRNFNMTVQEVGARYYGYGLEEDCIKIRVGIRVIGEVSFVIDYDVAKVEDVKIVRGNYLRSFFSGKFAVLRLRNR